MDRDRKYCIGIDTSNYRTSLAAVDTDGNMTGSYRKLLAVKKGERGLRQSEALFQHVENLPELSQSLFQDIDEGSICCIAVSIRPRPVEGSYMPVFNAGASLGRSLAAAVKVPLYEFSHQEGHIEAVRYYSPLRETERFICFHFSGGTTEAILAEETEGETEYSIVGGSRDISYGQLLDRIGVALGMAFPSGAEMDDIACSYNGELMKITGIKCREGFINLSGIETLCQRMIPSSDRNQLIATIFNSICTSMAEMTLEISSKFGVKDFLYAGGVSSSRYIRNRLPAMVGEDVRTVFGSPELSSDNAVGTALLGRRRYVSETR